MKVLLKCPRLKNFCSLLGARCHRWRAKDWDKALFASDSRPCCWIVGSKPEKATKPIWCLILRLQSQLNFHKKLIGFQCHSHSKAPIQAEFIILCSTNYFASRSFGSSSIRNKRCWSTGLAVCFLVCVHRGPTNRKGGRNADQWEEPGGGTAAWAYYYLLTYLPLPSSIADETTETGETRESSDNCETIENSENIETSEWSNWQR